MPSGERWTTLLGSLKESLSSLTVRLFDVRRTMECVVTLKSTSGARRYAGWERRTDDGGNFGRQMNPLVTDDD